MDKIESDRKKVEKQFEENQKKINQEEEKRKKEILDKDMKLNEKNVFINYLCISLFINLLIFFFFFFFLEKIIKRYSDCNRNFSL
jgi:uncharacterized membrane protein